MRKWILLLAPLVFLTLVATAFRLFLQPRIEAWALEYFRTALRENSPVQLQADTFRFEWLSPKIRLQRAVLSERTDVKVYGFKKLTIENLEAHLDVIQLLAGKIYLSLLVLENAQLHVDLAESKSGQTAPAKKQRLEVPVEEIFKTLEGLPIYRVALIDSQIRVTSEKHKLDVLANQFTMRLTNMSKRLNIDFQTSSSMVTFAGQTAPWSARFSGKLTPKTVEISSLEMAAAGQNIKMSGYFGDLPRLLVDPKGSFRIEARAEGESITAIFPDLTAPYRLKGNIALEAQADLRGFNLPHANFRLQSKAVFIGAYEVGSLTAQGELKDNTLQIAQAVLDHSSAKIELKEIVGRFSPGADQDKPAQFNLQAKVSTPELGLFQLLKQIDVGEVPLDLAVSGNFDCAGPILPKFNMVCVGDALLKDFYVRPDINEDPVIVALSGLSAKGGVQITDEAVTYNATATLGSDTGKSSGLISYSKGFQIQYETEGVSLAHVQKIGGLAVEGRAKISGSTSGNSRTAGFTMEVKGENLFFENYFLGDVSGKVAYNKGTLSFADLSGQVGSSVYRGKVDAHLLKGRLAVTGQSGQMQWSDLSTIFARHFAMPISLEGEGAFDIELEGPYQINQLNYKFNAQMPKINIAGESFSNGDLKVISEKGHARIASAQLRKGSRAVTATGQYDPAGKVTAEVVGEQLLIEESDYLSKLSSTMSGTLDGRLRILGDLASPTLVFDVNVGQLIIEDQEFPPSVANFSISRNETKGALSLFAGHLVSEYQVPHQDNGPFHLRVKAFDWNFATLAALMGGSSLLNEYETALTGQMELNSSRGGFWAASGQGTIQRFLLKRGDLVMENPGPMKATMNNGAAEFQQFRIQGGDNFVQVANGRIAKDNLRVRLEGRTNLRLFQLFVPVLEELGGDARFDMTVSGTLTKPEILGSSDLTEGFAKLKEFPHPLERASGHVQFSHSKILISDIRASLAGGSVTGDGSILLQGINDIPTTIRMKAEGVSLNVPDRIHSNGNLDLTFSGQWFPFLLSGQYRVTGGLFEKEFEEDVGVQRIQQSAYLPKVILKTAFEPVLLDIAVDLERPFPIKNSQVEGSAIGRLQVKGSPQSPVLFGNISLTSGSKFLFRDKVFEINTATAKFNDPKEINPELYLTARSRVSEYDVNILAQGSKKNLSVRMSSVPPLSEQDIVTLLALGTTSQKLDQVSQQAQESNSGYDIGTAILQSTVVKPVQKTLGVNLSFSSGYDDTKNVAVQRITVSKQVNEKTEITASRLQGEQTSAEAKVKYSLNPNVSLIGSFERNLSTDSNTGKINESQVGSDNIFGIDLEFKREFK